eukprot:m.374648 g.374648  ORF g.374648 m.374648 type:complete len:65 (-) comp74404_c0_seq1:24-218(-)
MVNTQGRETCTLTQLYMVTYSYVENGEYSKGTSPCSVSERTHCTNMMTPHLATHDSLLQCMVVC